MRPKVIFVAGARPNFIKVAPLLEVFREKRFFNPVLVHTGQHYDFKMSSIFFKDLAIPKPDIYLNVGSGSHAVQTAKILRTFEPVLLKEKPALVVVVGDVNSTLACSLAASKRHIPVAHVEAGLRSFDRSMPEEINRIATDRISDFLFVTERSGIENLKKEGVSHHKIFFVGNVMIDTLRASLPAIARSNVLKKYKLTKQSYAVVTLHRPSNVDSEGSLQNIVRVLRQIGSQTRLVFPVHPRTASQIRRFGLETIFKQIPGLVRTEPAGYIDFIRLVRDSSFVLTDSGGIQEEASVLHVPCLTIRENTERPCTVNQGTNALVGLNQKQIFSAVRKIMNGSWRKGIVPHLWDGRSASRIHTVLKTRRLCYNSTL